MVSTGHRRPLSVCHGELFFPPFLYHLLCHVRPCDLHDQCTCTVTPSGNSQRTSGSYCYVRKVTPKTGKFRAEEGHFVMIRTLQSVIPSCSLLSLCSLLVHNPV